MLDFTKYMESILHIIEIVIIYYVFGQAFERRIHSPYLCFVFLVGGVILNLTVEMGLGLYSLDSLILKLAMTFLLLRFLFKGKVFHLMLLFILSFLVLLICDVLVIQIAVHVFNISISKLDKIGISRVGLGLSSKLLFIVMSLQISKRFHPISGAGQKEFYQIFSLLLINTAFMVITGDIHFQRRGAVIGDATFGTIVFLGVIFLSFLTIKMTEKIVDHAQKERMWKLRETEYQRQIFYMENLEKTHRQIQSLRHDFTNHLYSIHGMLLAKKSHQAKKYVESLVKKAENLNMAFTVDSPYISGLLTAKTVLMEEKQISFVYDIRLPQNLLIAPLDMSIVLGNALDNAIEACEKVEKNNRFVSLEMFSDYGYIVIKIQNRFCPNQTKMNLQTTKSDSENHGYGMKNIEFVVRKYEGILKVKKTDDVFSLNVALSEQGLETK